MAKFEIKNGVAIIPEGTTEIGSSAFAGCPLLKSVTIPESVKVIGWNAFEGCPLNQIPKGLVEIKVMGVASTKSPAPEFCDFIYEQDTSM